MYICATRGAEKGRRCGARAPPGFEMVWRPPPWQTRPPPKKSENALIRGHIWKKFLGSPPDPPNWISAPPLGNFPFCAPGHLFLMGRRNCGRLLTFNVKFLWFNFDRTARGEGGRVRSEIHYFLRFWFNSKNVLDWERI